MTTCLGKSCSFHLLCMSFASFPFGFESGMWVLVALIPGHCLSIYFDLEISFKMRRNELFIIVYGMKFDLRPTDIDNVDNI